MRGRQYQVSQTIDSVSAAQTLAILTLPADRIAEITKIEVTSRGQPTAEQLDVALYRITIRLLLPIIYSIPWARPLCPGNPLRMTRKEV